MERALNYLGLINSTLLIIQIIVSGIYKLKETSPKENNSDKERINTDEKEYLERYKSYDLITTLIVSLVLAIIVITVLLIAGKGSISLPKVPIALLFLFCLYRIYIHTDSYNYLGYIKELFSDNNLIGLCELSDVVVIIGLILSITNTELVTAVKTMNSNSIQYQLIMVAQWIISCVSFLILLTTIVIETACFLREQNSLKKIQHRHKMIIQSLYKGVPTRKYLSENQYWPPIKTRHRIILYAKDCLYKAPILLILAMDSVFEVIQKTIIGIIRNIGLLMNIRIMEKDIITSARSLLKSFGWCIIASIAAVYIIIVFDNHFSNDFKDAYSYLTGIIIVPTIISEILQKRIRRKDNID